ncbi:hypothetical protein ACHAWO_011760 [Cyclotella atomus]|uniref:BAH domain-containing protein n=1 Tax=Cyclotella atomus TaxID=382360 RepID=A0ABD3PKL7_9STRA
MDESTAVGVDVHVSKQPHETAVYGQWRDRSEIVTRYIHFYNFRDSVPDDQHIDLPPSGFSSTHAIGDTVFCKVHNYNKYNEMCSDDIIYTETEDDYDNVVISDLVLGDAI